MSGVTAEFLQTRINQGDQAGAAEALRFTPSTAGVIGGLRIPPEFNFLRTKGRRETDPDVIALKALARALLDGIPTPRYEGDTHEQPVRPGETPDPWPLDPTAGEGLVDKLVQAVFVATQEAPGEYDDWTVTDKYRRRAGPRELYIHASLLCALAVNVLPAKPALHKGPNLLVGRGHQEGNCGSHKTIAVDFSFSEHFCVLRHWFSYYPLFGLDLTTAQCTVPTVPTDSNRNLERRSMNGSWLNWWISR